MAEKDRPALKPRKSYKIEHSDIEGVVEVFGSSVKAWERKGWKIVEEVPTVGSVVTVGEQPKKKNTLAPQEGTDK